MFALNLNNYKNRIIRCDEDNLCVQYVTHGYEGLGCNRVLVAKNTEGIALAGGPGPRQEGGRSVRRGATRTDLGTGIRRGFLILQLHIRYSKVFVYLILH